jgi:hypothetical protein
MHLNINCSLLKFSVHETAFPSTLCLDLTRVCLDKSGCSCKYRLVPLMCTLPPSSLRQNTCRMGSEGNNESFKSTPVWSFR